MNGKTNKLRRGSSQATHRAAALSLLIFEASPTGKGGLDWSNTMTISVARFWRADLYMYRYNACIIKLFYRNKVLL